MSTSTLCSSLRQLLHIRMPLQASSAIARTQLLFQSHRRLACRPPLCSQAPQQHRSVSTTLRCLVTNSSLSLGGSQGREEGFASTPKACPACGQKCFRPLVLQRHVQRCCPDLLLQAGHRFTDLDFVDMDEKALETWLVNAKEREIEKQQQAVRLSSVIFKQGE
jgi:hypothetical protein